MPSASHLGLDDDAFRLQNEVDTRACSGPLGGEVLGPHIVEEDAEQAVKEVLNVVLVFRDDRRPPALPVGERVEELTEAATDALHQLDVLAVPGTEQRLLRLDEDLALGEQRAVESCVVGVLPVREGRRRAVFGRLAKQACLTWRLEEVLDLVRVPVAVELGTEAVTELLRDNVQGLRVPRVVALDELFYLLLRRQQLAVALDVPS